MFLAAFLIGLREGLEAALIIGILIAFVRKRGRGEAIVGIWSGVGVAVIGSVIAGAVLTFGRYGLSFKTQETIGGVMSLVAVGMVTWMVLWMAAAGQNLKGELETSASTALRPGGGRGLFWLALLSVGREGLETTLLLWGWALQPTALAGALVGIICSVGLGYLAFKGMLRIRFSTFFTITGGLLVIVAAGILAYGIHDLQEAGLLPGPFSGAPITPTDFRTGEVLVGFFTDRPFWGAAYPFGWAFDLQHLISPDGAPAAILKGTIGFTPRMSWLQLTAWAAYLLIVLPIFLRRITTTNRVTTTQPRAGNEPLEGKETNEVSNCA